MKITASHLSLSSSRNHQESFSSSRTVEARRDRVSLSGPTESGTITQALSQLFETRTTAAPATADETDESGTVLDPRLLTMKRLIEALTGKKLTLSHIADFQASPASPSSPLPDATPFQITQITRHYESETTRFGAQGQVLTDDGQEIQFFVRLDMARATYQESRTAISGNAALTDPLVINFSGNPAELTDVRFAFDLNADGITEQMPWLSRGSGFLVWDRDRDGQVTSGRELFGPATGNGFGELSELDADRNGWIDSGDPAFEDLYLWSGDTPASARLEPLHVHGIGAIHTSGISTPFSLKSPDTLETLGQIRETGVFIKTDGTAGTVQELDLSTRP